ncbi:hypothetical protein BpHYR1_033011 [Brachionus plicatilis]|uniref:Uncharacterized protein n=1 Tax=Brachionus plicatilis TaxID=10195 RepID=A0A3M7PTH9_BRAPC|nr:hypothetical protein BpHYR1_033011 [Brachionus plicatilis]
MRSSTKEILLTLGPDHKLKMDIFISSQKAPSNSIYHNKHNKFITIFTLFLIKGNFVKFSKKYRICYTHVLFAEILHILGRLIQLFMLHHVVSTELILNKKKMNFNLKKKNVYIKLVAEFHSKEFIISASA